MIAVIYGLFLTTMDFLGPNYDPVASGHKAASNVYGLFGTADAEIKRNEAESPHATPVAYKLARPYAITADLSAIFGGKIEVGLASLLHSAENKATNQS
jgi:hypothetical protein